MTQRTDDYEAKVIKSLPRALGKMMALHCLLGYRYACTGLSPADKRWWIVRDPNGKSMMRVGGLHLHDVVPRVETEIQQRHKREVDLGLLS